MSLNLTLDVNGEKIATVCISRIETRQDRYHRYRWTYYRYHDHQVVQAALAGPPVAKLGALHGETWHHEHQGAEELARKVLMAVTRELDAKIPTAHHL